ncbi:MAG: hypothetical protein IPM60_17595 [Rhodospirillales bacterium]|nr:hypothetical protein [Rhodospirillales bacterium]
MTSTTPEYAETEKIAEKRYRNTIDNDPLPDIPPALLNSSDVLRYVCLVGLIHPFDPRNLKAASYKVSIGDRFIYWDSSGREHDQDLTEAGKSKFCLEPNSIGFITTKETFRLPHYIAARFNLRINDVHRGLLLGTGPLVDPGFSGKLLVPLHNLTTNEYEYRSGDPIAWFEFTKLSPNFWDAKFRNGKSVEELKKKYRCFPEEKVNRDPIMYLREAYKGPIRSSIPEAIAQSKDDATKARADAEEAKLAAQESEEASKKASETFRNYGIGALAVLLVAIGALVIAGYQLVSQVQGIIADVQRDLQTTIATGESTEDTQARLSELEKQLVYCF